MTQKEEFTVCEASFITDQPARRINRLFDEGPIEWSSKKGAGATRILHLWDLFFLVATGEEPLSHLDLAGREKVYRQISSSWTSWVPPRGKEPKRVQLSESVELVFSALWDRVRVRAKELERAKGMVLVDPDVRGGEPVLLGTRVPVQVVSDLLREGTEEAEILKHYPSLTPELLHSAEVYARAFPRRGRPPRHPWHARSS